MVSGLGMSVDTIGDLYTINAGVPQLHLPQLLSLIHIYLNLGTVPKLRCRLRHATQPQPTNRDLKLGTVPKTRS